MPSDIYIGELYSVFRRDTQPDWAMTGHRPGPEHVLFMGLKGRADYTVNGEHLTIEPGDVALLPPACARDAFALPGQQWVFTGAIFRLYGATEGLPLRVRAGLYPCQRLMADALRSFDMDNLIQARARLSDVLHVFLTTAEQHHADARIGHILQDLRQRPASFAPTVEYLIDQSGLSPSRFRALFKAATGQAIHHWLTRRRLLYARSLLMNEGYAVSEAGEAIGIDDQHYFSRIFKKHFGLPPSACRE